MFSTNFTDDDARAAVLRAIRTLAVLSVVATPLLWLKLGWQSAALFVVGAAISGAALWEWLRLMVAVMEHMDAGGQAKPMARMLIGFFLRLGLTVVVLYGSLKFLDGSIYALAAGLGLGIFALTVEGLKLMKAWTV